MGDMFNQYFINQPAEVIHRGRWQKLSLRQLKAVITINQGLQET